MESNPMEKPPEEGSEKEKKEREACLFVCEAAESVFRESERKVKEEKNFSPIDKKCSKRYLIENTSDYMVALAQRERQESERLFESVKEKNEYYEEKIAGKLKTFLKKEEVLIRALAEMESLFPELALFIKSQKPYLKQKMKDAEKGMKE